MKLAVALFVALCYVVSANAHSRHHHSHATGLWRTDNRNNKFVNMNCPDGGRVTEEEYGPNEGVAFFSGSKNGGSSTCTFQLTGPAGYKTELTVTFRTEGGSDSCADGGELTIYKGQGSGGQQIAHACDKLNKQVYTIQDNKAFINYVKENNKGVLRVNFRFLAHKSEHRSESLNLFEAWKKSSSKRHHHDNKED